MRQEVYDDERPLSDYDPRGTRVFVHLCSATQWLTVTGEEPPVTPVSARAYTEAGLPWFDYYDADAADLPPSQALADVTPVGNWLGIDPRLEGLKQPQEIVPVGPDKHGAPSSRELVVDSEPTGSSPPSRSRRRRLCVSSRLRIHYRVLPGMAVRHASHLIGEGCGLLAAGGVAIPHDQQGPPRLDKRRDHVPKHLAGIRFWVRAPSG